MTTSVETVLQTLREHDGPVLLDLDETAYLRNSTEDFLDSVRPRLVLWFILKLLDVLKPWKFLGGEVVRDSIRVRVVLALFPWALALYRRKVTVLAGAYKNRELLAAASSGGREPYVVTLGYEPIVRPLVRAMGLDVQRLVACGFALEERRLGKLPLAMRSLAPDLLRSSAFVTDSEMDRPLLDVCKVPLLVRFAEADYRKALADVYVPGRYLSEVKRPGQRYILRGILQDDFAFWILASWFVHPHALHPLGLGFLLVSFWSIYELGYVENDQLGAKFEESPQITREFQEQRVVVPSVAPWLFAVVFGALGVLATGLSHHRFWPPLLEPGLDVRSFVKSFALWMALLVTVRSVFWIYNRLDKLTRVWLFLPLQAARAFAFVAVIPVGFAGALGLASHTVARWFPYYAYRYGQGWSGNTTALSRLLLFAGLSGMLSVSAGLGWLDDPTFWVLLVWMGVRARKELAQVFAKAHRIDRAPRGS